MIELHSSASARNEEESAERMRRAQEYQEPDWVRNGEAETVSTPEGASLIEDELYCIACDKFFKSDNAMANHNKYVRRLCCSIVVCGRPGLLEDLSERPAQRP